MNVIPKLSQLSPRVWRILGMNPGPMTLQGTNIYLVGTGPVRTLIDAGQDGFPEYISNLSNLLKEQKVKIKDLIITHWHRDHIGALAEIDSIIDGEKPTVHKFRRTDDDEVPASMGFKEMRDNQTFSVEGATLRIIHTPGHTTDHSALYLEEENALFSGDCILGEGTAVFEDLHDYMLSLHKILDLKPTTIYPAHGPVVSKPIEVIQYYIKHRLQRESQVLEYLTSQSIAQTPMEIVKGVYKETPEHLHPAAEVNVRHHLEKLLKEKRILEKDDSFFIETKQKY